MIMRHIDGCRDMPMRVLLGVYALGALPVEQIEALEAHLMLCPPCLLECAELTWTATWLRALSDVDFVDRATGLSRCQVTPRRLTSGISGRSRRPPVLPGAADG